jgi:hypothetical protein
MSVEIGFRGQNVRTPTGGITVAGPLAAENTRVLGAGLVAANAGVREELFLFPRDAFDNVLSQTDHAFFLILHRQRDGEVVTRSRAIPDPRTPGKYVVEYMARQAEPHRLEVAYGGTLARPLPEAEELLLTASTVEVTAALPSATESMIVGNFGPYIADEEGWFDISSRDTFGNLRTVPADLDTLKLSLATHSGEFFDDVAFTVESPPDMGPEVSPHFSHRILVTIPEPGALLLEWSLSGVDVMNPSTRQPYRATVTSGRVNARQTVYDGTRLVAGLYAEFQATFPIDTKDANGFQLSTPLPTTSRFLVTFSVTTNGLDVTGSMDSALKYVGTGRYLVTFTPPGFGDSETHGLTIAVSFRIDGAPAEPVGVDAGLTGRLDVLVLNPPMDDSQPVYEVRIFALRSPPWYGCCAC